ncbi:chemotaxis protein [Bradyrhizobium sp. 2TAF24]|uniref:chemotaxis protein n=1 Tax=Bradyrhizobium sp. 2TAF24 TaxID=3233011 RepID=UPI003F9294C1
MSAGRLEDTAAGARSAVAAVTVRIEDTFARVGDHLGRSHGIFEGLQRDLAAISTQLSGADMESASTALQAIAERLTGLADALPRQSVALKAIGEGCSDIALLLQRLVKSIQMVAVIARSARIEAVSLSNNRGHFIDFTQEVLDLAKSAQGLVDACSRDQERLAQAIGAALSRQTQFELAYGGGLRSVGADLVAAYAEIRRGQAQSCDVAQAASAGAAQISMAVGEMIVSLQAGDSVRQRLEHVCTALALVDRPDDARLVPEQVAGQACASLVLRLQSGQLADTIGGFEAEIDRIGRGLQVLSADAARMIDGGRALYSDRDGGMGSFLDAVKQGLAQASALIAQCEIARRSVADATAIFEGTLTQFGRTIAELGEAVADIILVGMNASLKAAHLGTEGHALVVIANELGSTAKDISGSAELLKPILDKIGEAAASLRDLQQHGDTAQVGDLAPTIAQVVQDIGGGNAQLFALRGRLSTEGEQFGQLIRAAEERLRGFAHELRGVKHLVNDLAAAGEPVATIGQADRHGFGELVRNELYPLYTMAGERDVHNAFLRQLGLAPVVEIAAAAPADAAADDVLFF